MAAIQCPLGESLGLVAPYYNLALVIIVIILFIRLFKTHDKKTYIEPWKFLFFAISVFVLEELLTVLKDSGIVSIPRITNSVFEMVIITSFIYMLLLQKEYLKKKR